MKLEKTLNYTFLLYMVILLFFSIYSEIKIYAYIGMIIISLLFIILNFKNIKHDKINLVLLLVSIAYFMNIVTKTYALDLKTNLIGLAESSSIALSMIALRNTITKKKTKELFLSWIQTISTISFFLSIFSYTYYDTFLNLKIFSAYGDTYKNTIDRFYGILNYCNAQAVLFLISCFISLIKKKKTILDRFIIYISIIGFSYCFSKMITITFIVMLLLTCIYKYLKKKQFKYIIQELISLVIPVLLSITTYRYFLITNNILIYMLENIALFILYIVIIKIIEKIKYKVILDVIILVPVIVLTINPIILPLTIKNVHTTSSESAYIAELILEPNKEYKFKIDYSNLKDEQFVLQKAYVENNVLVLRDYIIFKTNEATISIEDNVEYLMLKVNNLNSSTNLKINCIYLNNKKININTLLVPYQITKQIELTKYDQESVTHRIDYYLDALDYIKENKYIFGKGKDTFKYYRENSLDNKYNELNVHSIVLERWLDNGILGLVYICFIYLSGIASMIKKRNKSKYLIWFIMFSSISLFSAVDFYLSITFLQVLHLLSYIVIVKDDYKYMKKSR